MTITAKYVSRCRKCGQPIKVGEKINWEKGRGAEHVTCQAKVEPALNSPPPVDAAGNVDPAEEAAKYGRKAVAGATVRHFSRQVSKGEHCIANGTVERINGKRYVAIAHAKPRYFSRDDLEDFDMFDRQPGLWYDWQGVEVEPTDEEQTADQAKADAKAEEAKRSARRKEIEDLVRQLANRTDHSLPQGLVDCWGRRGAAGHDVLLSDGKEVVAYSQSSYDDDWYTWVLRDAAIAVEAMALKQSIR